ncbi:MAG TPA: hypothetical protein VN041_12170 [Microbacterium sp.]|nr:hypothetical protein [Microbacterium sp.]
MSSDLRAWFSAQLKPLLPKRPDGSPAWRYIPNQDTPAAITVPTLVFKLLELDPLPEAPLGALRARIVLTLLSPHEDDVKAENTLDNQVIELVTALDPHSTISWETARKVRDAKTDRLGWDFTVTAVINKE